MFPFLRWLGSAPWPYMYVRTLNSLFYNTVLYMYGVIITWYNQCRIQLDLSVHILPFSYEQFISSYGGRMYPLSSQSSFFWPKLTPSNVPVMSFQQQPSRKITTHEQAGNCHDKDSTLPRKYLDCFLGKHAFPVFFLGLRRVYSYWRLLFGKELPHYHGRAHYGRCLHGCRCPVFAPNNRRCGR